MHISNVCAHCKEKTKSKKRDFSEQTWSVLLVMGEVDKSTVDQPLCEDCYGEIREIMIDRAAEIEAAITQPIAAVAKQLEAKNQDKKAQTGKPAAKGGRKVAKLAS